MYDVIVVGAGTAGCVAARELADNDKKVLIIEKKHHIAGNCYDEKDDHGVLIHVYGPHIFHTGRENVYEYLSRFTEWYSFRHEVVANVHGEYMPVPFNLHTLKKAYGEEKGKKLEDKLVSVYGMGTKVPILDLMNHSDEDLQKIGKYVYDNIKTYSRCTICDLTLFARHCSLDGLRKLCFFTLGVQKNFRRYLG